MILMNQGLLTKVNDHAVRCWDGIQTILLYTSVLALMLSMNSNFQSLVCYELINLISMILMVCQDHHQYH